MKKQEINEKIQDLKNIVGTYALKALLSGRPLKIWRRSTPHNWFIEDSRGHNLLWHSDDDYNRKLPDLSMFQKVSDSRSKILKYWGSDSELPELTLYTLEKEFRTDRRVFCG